LQDAPARACDVQPENASRPGSGRREAEQELDRRRLARPVRAEKTEDFPAADLEGQPIHGDDVAEPLGQALDLDHARGHDLTR